MTTLLVCMLSEVSAVECVDPYYQKRILAVEATTISFDIITDLMSESIFPVQKECVC